MYDMHFLQPFANTRPYLKFLLTRTFGEELGKKEENEQVKLESVKLQVTKGLKI